MRKFFIFIKRYFVALSRRIAIKRLSSRFLAIMILLTLIPLSILGYISSKIFESSIIKSTIESYQSDLAISSEILSQVFDTIRDALRLVLLNDNIIYELSAPKASEMVVDLELKRLLRLHSSIESVVLFGLNDKRRFYQRSESNDSFNIEEFSLDKIVRSKWFQDLGWSGKEAFLGQDVFSAISDYGSSKFSCVKIVKSLDTRKALGLAIVNINKDIFSMVFPIVLQKNPGSYLLISRALNNEPKIVYTSRDGQIITKYINELNTKVKNKDLIISTVYNENADWELVHICSRWDVIRNALAIRSITIAMCLIMALIVGGLSVILAYSITRQLEQLERWIVKGDWENSHDHEFEHVNDEIGSITNRFKIIVRQNLQLKRRVYEYHVKQREAEFKRLQAQINPHFLYNTLDCIYWQAMLKGVTDVAQMAVSLSRVFRYCISMGGETSSIREEIEHIKDYLIIQNIRHNNKISVEWAIEDDVLDARVLKLVLQPIVENAIYHGLEAKEENGKIIISARKYNGGVIFNINDDGVGFNPRRQKGKGFGLKNTEERIKLFYGDRGTIKVRSRIGIGTNVVLFFPPESESIYTKVGTG